MNEIGVVVNFKSLLTILHKNTWDGERRMLTVRMIDRLITS